MNHKYKITNSQIFILRIKKIKEEKKRFVKIYSSEEYLQMRTKLFLSEDKKSGFGINPDGALISLFSLEKGRGEELVKTAISKGAVNLKCIGDELKNFYTRFGFKVTKKTSWDELSPSLPRNRWDYKKFGKPNFYMMEIFISKRNESRGKP